MHVLDNLTQIGFWGFAVLFGMVKVLTIDRMALAERRFELMLGKLRSGVM